MKLQSKAAFAIITFLTVQSYSSAQALPFCAWPLETTGAGITNVAYPDTNATYWTMPFDSLRWKAMVIEGTYPESRFFSFSSYVATGSSVGSLIDIDIDPDPGSTNPFRRKPSGRAHRYTVTMSQDEPSDTGGNHLALGDTRLAWVIYRIYVPDAGLGRQAGASLPDVKVIGYDGRAHSVRPCRSHNFLALAQRLKDALMVNGFDSTGATLLDKLTQPDEQGPADDGACQPTPLISWIPKNTGGYFPNPANKYIAIPGLCFEPERIVVVRGKGAVFPDTYNGKPVWEPPGIRMRYWSMCNNNQQAPFPVIGCAADRATALDDRSYYTYVLSEGESGTRPPQPPSWIPPGATWIPWGAKDKNNILIFRNMLPKSNFQHSVQAAEEAGCVVDNQQGAVPPRDEIVKEGSCAHGVMGHYYPTAVYCDKQVFIDSGWQGCFAAAGVKGP